MYRVVNVTLAKASTTSLAVPLVGKCCLKVLQAANLAAGLWVLVNIMPYQLLSDDQRLIKYLTVRSLLTLFSAVNTI